jgi:glyoxylase-like metal-dependent hydrolase (beta-lactamase superfamily II)
LLHPRGGYNVSLLHGSASQSAGRNGMSADTYEVYAIKYATRNAQRRDHFIGGDPHDAPMPMDYFVWLIRNAARTIVVDTGFTREVGEARKRTFLRAPAEGLALMNVKAADVKDVIITHMHYDHVGTFQDFPQAQFHLQDDEMTFATGRHMRHTRFRHSIEVEDVVGMVRLVFGDRVTFHRGDTDLAPGVSLHHIGGHTPGLQCVRVMTQRGWVVLASDATHYYEHFEMDRCFPTVFNIGDTLEGYAILRRLAATPRHIIPGHDPLVMQRYPAVSKALDGIAVRLDVAPRE